MKHTDYEATIRRVNDQYAPLLQALNDCGVSAAIWQTGGMCMAIGVTPRTRRAAPHVAAQMTIAEPLPHKRAQLDLPFGLRYDFEHWRVTVIDTAAGDDEEITYTLPFAFWDARHDQLVAGVVAGLVRAHVAVSPATRPAA